MVSSSMYKIGTIFKLTNTGIRWVPTLLLLVGAISFPFTEKIIHISIISLYLEENYRFQIVENVSYSYNRCL